MRKNGTVKEENGKKIEKRKGEKSEIALHFQQMTETFKGSTKMEISTGKKPKISVGKNQEKWLCPLP